MSRLVSVKVRYTDVVTFTQERTLDIPWTDWKVKYAGTRVVLFARGDCLVATDLAQAKYELVDTKRRTLVVSLPPPSLLSPRVIFAPPGQWGSEIYAVSNQGVEAIIPGDDSRKRAIDGAMRLAQKRIEEAGRARDVTEAAKANSEKVLRGVFDALGWKASFRWRYPAGVAATASSSRTARKLSPSTTDWRIVDTGAAAAHVDVRTGWVRSRGPFNGNFGRKSTQVS
jgi:hypothetical protein